MSDHLLFSSSHGAHLALPFRPLPSRRLSLKVTALHLIGPVPEEFTRLIAPFYVLPSVHDKSTVAPRPPQLCPAKPFSDLRRLIGLPSTSP